MLCFPTFLCVSFCYFVLSCHLVFCRLSHFLLIFTSHLPLTITSQYTQIHYGHYIQTLIHVAELFALIYLLIFTSYALIIVPACILVSKATFHKLSFTSVDCMAIVKCLQQHLVIVYFVKIIFLEIFEVTGIKIPRKWHAYTHACTNK